MYKWKDFKKITTYYNGLIKLDKSEYEIRFSRLKNGILLSTMVIDCYTVSFQIEYEGENNIDYKNIIVSYKDFYETVKKIKGIKELDVIVENNELILITDKNISEKVSCNKILTRDFVAENTSKVNISSFKNAFLFSDNCAKAGIYEFDKNFVIRIEENHLYLNSYNRGIYVGNKIDIKDGDSISFKIDYAHSSMIKKWLKYASDPVKGILSDDLSLEIFKSYLRFSISHISLILPISRENVDLISEKYKDLTDFQYPMKESVNLKIINQCYEAAKAEKVANVELNDIFHEKSFISRPMFCNLIDLLEDFDVESFVVNSKDLILEFKIELETLKTKILLFAMTPKNQLGEIEDQNI